VKPIRKVLEIVGSFVSTAYTRACGLSRLAAHSCTLCASRVWPTFDLPLEIGYNCCLDLDDIGERE
jgi:hypothetical protein